MSVFTSENLALLQAWSATLGPVQAIVNTPEQTAQAAAAQCGLFYRFLTGNGAWDTRPSFCNRYLICEACRKRRADKIKEQLEYASQMGDLVAYSLDSGSEEAMSIHRALGAENYYCIPGVDGTETLFTNKSYGDKFGSRQPVAVDMTYLQEADFMDLAKTPGGKRITGSLGKKISLGPSEPDPNEDTSENKSYTFSAEMPQVHSEGSTLEEEYEDIVESVRLTPDIPNMQDQEAVKAALQLRMDAFVQLRKARGCKVYMQYRLTKVRVTPTLGWVTWFEGAQLKDCVRNLPVWSDRGSTTTSIT